MNYPTAAQQDRQSTPSPPLME